MSNEKLQEGQVVYRRAHNIKGRNKIQDAWDSTPYKVVRCPDGHGAVYSIVPVDGGGNLRHIHRCELRPAYVSLDDPGLPDHQQTSEDQDGDMVAVFLMPGVAPVQDVGIRFRPSQECNVYNGDGANDHQPSQQEEVVVRRTKRPTAGQHSNRFHLPWPVCTSEVQLNSQFAPPMVRLSNSNPTEMFRPWL